MRAVVVAHGDALASDRIHAAQADLLIAADGGARACVAWGLRPAMVVGDLDSLGPAEAEELARGGAEVVAYPAAKDESDTELALRRALAAGASTVTLLGALGGARLDHELANVLLLADPRFAERVRLIRGATTARALQGPGTLMLEGGTGDGVSLLPVGDAAGVVTEGLAYPLRGETLRTGAPRGLSNIVERSPASVTLGSGALLVIEIARGGGE